MDVILYYNNTSESFYVFSFKTDVVYGEYMMSFSDKKELY